MATDYYQALGVSRNADADEIQRAYRKLARQYHPDVNHAPGAEDRFKEISEAYQVLSDPESRRRYDRFGADFRRAAETTGPTGQTGSTGSTGRRTGFGGGIDIDDLFGEFFGRTVGADQSAELELTVEQAYRGGRRTVTVSGPAGVREYEVTIPAGVVSGQRIRVSGDRAGDLHLVVRIAPHPRYRLAGRDVHIGLPVTPWEAALGATVPVTAPGGEVKVRVPPGSSTGRKLRLRGEGMPNQHGRPGDLYVEVRVHVPPRPRKRERELFAELAAVSDFDPRTQR